MCKNSRNNTGDKDTYMYSVMATHGAISELSSSQETWTVYGERLEQYLMANKIEDAD